MSEYGRFLSPEARHEAEKPKFVFTDISDIQEGMAQDASLAQFNEKPEALEENNVSWWKKPFKKAFWKNVGKRGTSLGRSIWKQNLARDYYEVSGKKQAEAKMQASGSLFAVEKKFDPNEPGISEAEKQNRLKAQKTAHDEYVSAITRRFAGATGELAGDFVHKEHGGEAVETLGRTEAEVQIKRKLEETVRAFAGGEISEEQVLEKEKAIWAEIKGVKPEVVKKGKMYASNLLEMAKWAKEEVEKQVRQNIDHNLAVRNLQLDFDVVVGRAKSGAKTEAQFNAVENAVDKIMAKTRGLPSIIFNEATITAAVTAAYFVEKSLFTKGLYSVAGLVGFGVGAGATAAFKEGKTLEKERMQHAREMAQGRKFEESSATRRKELEKFRLKFQTAEELEQNLDAKLFNFLESGTDLRTLSPEGYKQALEAVAEIDARILEGERGVVVKKRKWLKFWKKEYKEERHSADLIGYSDPTQIAKEEGQLDMARAAAKIALKKWCLANGKTEAQFKADLQASVEAKIHGFYAGEEGIDKQNERFKEFKKKKMWQAGKKAAVWGTIFGTAIQEASAFKQDHTYGLAEHAWDAFRGNEHHLAPEETATALENAFAYGQKNINEGLDYLFPTAHAAGPNIEVQIGGSKYSLPDGFRLEDNPATANPNDKVLIDSKGVSHTLEFKADGTPTADSKKWLLDNGYKLDEIISPAGPKGIHSLDVDATKKQFPDLAHHTRIDWHDEPGKFKSAIHNMWLEFEGKQQMGYLVTRGDKVYLDCSKVIQNFVKEVSERINDPSFGQVEGYTNADGSPFVDSKMMHLKDQIQQAINNGDINRYFQAVVIPTEGANSAGLSDLVQGADSSGLIELNGKYDWSKMFIDPATGHVDPKMLHDGHLPFRFLEMRFDGHVMNTAQGAGEAGPMPFFKLTPPLDELPPTTFPPLTYVGRRKGLEETNWTPPPQRPKREPLPEIPYYGYYNSPERSEYYRQRISPTLRENPDAILDFNREMDWYISNLENQNPEYADELRELMQQPDMLIPMSNECKAVACIPVYALGEGKGIEHTLEQYRKQIINGSVKSDEFELLLFLNHPQDRLKGMTILSGAEERVRNGNPEAYDTAEVIRQYKLKHPELKIRVLEKEYETRPKWGVIIKSVYDVACLRAKSRSNPVSKDIVLLTNDADVRDMSDTYLRLVIDEFDKSDGSKQIDGLATRMDDDPNVYRKWPNFFLANRFRQFLEAQTRAGISGSGEINSLPYNFSSRGSKEKYINTWGASTALRGSTYCGIGGADLSVDAGADSELGRVITNSRRGGKRKLDNANFPIKFLNSAWLETDPRRPLGIYKKGKPLVATWSEWDEMNVYGETLADQNEGDSEALDPVRLSKEINVMMKSWWGLDADSMVVKKALGWLGLKEGDYDIVDIGYTDRVGVQKTYRGIKINNISNLKTGVDAWKTKRERLDEAKANRLKKAQAVKSIGQASTPSNPDNGKIWDEETFRFIEPQPEAPINQTTEDDDLWDDEGNRPVPKNLKSGKLPSVASEPSRLPESGGNTKPVESGPGRGANEPVQSAQREAPAPKAEQGNVRERESRETKMIELLNAFDANPYEFIYDKGLARVSEAGFSTNRFLKELRLQHGISNADLATIKQRTRVMSPKGPIMGKGREVAQYARMILATKPEMRAQWIGLDDGRYNKFSKELIVAEVKKDISQKTFNPDKIVELEREFAQGPIFVLDSVLSANPAVLRKANEAFKQAINNGEAQDNSDDKARVFKTTLDAYQQGSLKLTKQRGRKSQKK